MFILYDLIFIIFALIYLPVFLLRNKLHKGFTQRLGFLPPELKLKQPIWIHAVSVGEAKTAELLVKQLRIIYPKKQFALSTTTPTGNKIARNFSGENDFVFYLPLDISFVTKKVIRLINPCFCIIMETEVWPNLITQLYAAGIPSVVVNARISDNSFLGYRLIKPLLKPILNKMRFFCVQTAQDAQRLRALGLSNDKLKITGNMKYDIAALVDSKADYISSRLRLGLEEAAQLVVAGSTHPQEEEIILGAYKQVMGSSPNARLLIAPRHPERAREVAKLAARIGFEVTFISKLTSGSESKSQDPIFILDTIGELLSFYAIADVVFVGGSLVNNGGHNILEPALFEKPILFGPHMSNFKQMSELFLNNSAAIMVAGGQELSANIQSLLNNSSGISSIGKKARQLVLDNQGATIRNAELIEKVLNP